MEAEMRRSLLAGDVDSLVMWGSLIGPRWLSSLTRRRCGPTDGCWDDVRKVFDEMSDGNVVTWNAYISNSVFEGRMYDAFCAFVEFRGAGEEGNSITYCVVLSGEAGSWGFDSKLPYEPELTREVGSGEEIGSHVLFAVENYDDFVDTLKEKGIGFLNFSIGERRQGFFSHPDEYKIEGNEWLKDIPAPLIL
ncbi:hypothetical protein Syun_029265 [Stephania yunnanensis]|uniref:VOC domain-containing protein n=1 Tax=Stephania yunnanensis TaxID=152371 RepID=A0AAP0E5B1_9MAGN